MKYENYLCKNRTRNLKNPKVDAKVKYENYLCKNRTRKERSREFQIFGNYEVYQMKSTKKSKKSHVEREIIKTEKGGQGNGRGEKKRIKCQRIEG